jgi:sugar O-acyltransferase (sialic acid O-acetyltransferase NeuD family)
MLPVIVIGAGGHAWVVVDALLAQGRAVLGLVDGAGASTGTRVAGLPALGDDEQLLRLHPPGSVALANGIGGAGAPGAVAQGSLRRRVQERLAARGYRFDSVVHPAATVSPLAELGPGVQILARAVVQPGVQLAEGCIINTGAIVEHHGRIGRFAHVAPGAVLCGNVVLGDEAHVGACAVVRQGLRLGARTVVGAGAALVADLDAGLATGVPARHRPSELDAMRP